MDTKSHNKQPPEPKACAVSNSENASFILGTGKLVTPQKHVAEMTPSLCNPDTFKSPLNFSTITVEQLGITPESFVRNSSGKSPSHLKKSRRRSAVGARGSPETNHLIRFIAQHRSLKTPERSPLAHNSPFQGSPGLYRNGNSFRERISAFRAAFHSVQDTENTAGCSEADRGSKTSGLMYAAKKEGIVEYQQSGFPVNLSSKRRKLSSQTSSDEQFSKVGGSVSVHVRTEEDRAHPVGAPACLTEPDEPGSALTGSVVAESAPSAELTGALSAEMSSETIPDVTSPAPPVYRSISSPEMFVLRSVLKKPTGKLLSESLQEHHNNICDGGTHPSLISNCKEQKPDQENVEVSAFVNVRKRKRVTFGEDLSPELFDESLPANTPLRKGGTPVRPKDSSDTSPLLLQPDFDDKGENLENIEPLQSPCAVLSPSKASVSEVLPGTDTFTSNNHEKTASCKVDRPTRTSSKRKQLMGYTDENAGNSDNAEVKPCKEKRTNKKRSQETKCRNRTLPKKKQVSSSCRKKKGRGKKGFQKCLYGERDIASKKPLLSPIPELPELSETAPSAPGIQRRYSDDFHSRGKVEEVSPPELSEKRKKIWFQNSEDWPTLPVLEGMAELEVWPGIVASGGGPEMHHMATEDHGSSPRAESQLESVQGPKPESSHPPGASVVEEFVSGHPEPACVPQGWEGTVAGQHAEKLCGGRHISEGNEKREKEGMFPVTVEGKLPCSHLLSDSEKELRGLEDVLIGNTKAPTSRSENMRRKSAESGCNMSCKVKKHRRRSVCYSDSHSLHLEQNGNHTPSCSVGSSVEVSLESSELYQDLSDAIEQSFQRTNRATQVRRSTRLQGGTESQGLVWMSLPAPSTSQKTKRRTISAVDNREFESMCPREETVSSSQNPGAIPSISGSESSQSLLWGPPAPRKRRKSFCVSTPLAPSATQPASHWQTSKGGGKLSVALQGPTTKS
uniref:cell division cycle-associated protein 2 isoform X2 n=1 Tax=Jaculus jaculus TaxID=51337 RepID=UPI001E1B40D1|nr:cell division cycle-associated protein 2 isoform X2 [Jaculus jaculus]